MTKSRTTHPDSPFGRLSRIYQQSFDTSAQHNLDALVAIVELRADLTEQEDHAALSAKRNGATWQQIADALGITRQRAHQRWGRVTDFAGYDPK